MEGNCGLRTLDFEPSQVLKTFDEGVIDYF